MRILGIDPGVAIVGFGLIESERGAVRMLQYGAVNTSAGLPLATRLVQIEQDLTQLIQQFKPDEIAIEELFFSKNITTGIAVAHGRGVILPRPDDAADALAIAICHARSATSLLRRKDPNVKETV